MRGSPVAELDPLFSFEMSIGAKAMFCFYVTQFVSAAPNISTECRNMFERRDTPKRFISNKHRKSHINTAGATIKEPTFARGGNANTNLGNLRLGPNRDKGTNKGTFAVYFMATSPGDVFRVLLNHSMEMNV